MSGFAVVGQSEYYATAGGCQRLQSYDGERQFTYMKNYKTLAADLGAKRFEGPLMVCHIRNWRLAQIRDIAGCEPTITFPNPKPNIICVEIPVTDGRAFIGGPSGGDDIINDGMMLLFPAAGSSYEKNSD